MRSGTWIATLAWLLTAATCALADGPADGVKAWPLEVTQGGQAGFTLMSGKQTGIQFTNELLPWPEATNQNLLNGAGLTLGGYDDDGWDDFFVTDMVSSFHGLSNLASKLPLPRFLRVS